MKLLYNYGVALVLAAWMAVWAIVGAWVLPELWTALLVVAGGVQTWGLGRRYYRRHRGHRLS